MEEALTLKFGGAAAADTHGNANQSNWADSDDDAASQHEYGMHNTDSGDQPHPASPTPAAKPEGPHAAGSQSCSALANSG